MNSVTWIKPLWQSAAVRAMCHMDANFGANPRGRTPGALIKSLAAVYAPAIFVLPGRFRGEGLRSQRAGWE